MKTADRLTTRGTLGVVSQHLLPKSHNTILNECRNSNEMKVQHWLGACCRGWNPCQLQRQQVNDRRLYAWQDVQDCIKAFPVHVFVIPHRLQQGLHRAKSRNAGATACMNLANVYTVCLAALQQPCDLCGRRKGGAAAGTTHGPAKLQQN
jgi:hypothetical protein